MHDRRDKLAVLKCKMCGGSLTVLDGASVCRCDYCGTSQTLPQTDSDKIRPMFDRANTLRMANDFDSAAAAYENIISECPDDAEAHWGICLCRYGIEYVKDHRTGKRIATCRRTQFRSILEDPDFAMAVRYADPAAEAVYREEAAYINAIQKKILEISAGEDPFDIFICYKETDDLGSRTTDSVIAQDIYDVLTDKGYRVFFSRITLETKLGKEYEPYIFAALNSASVMLVVGTAPENFNSTWVKNEWSRYLALIEQGKGKTIIPCYRNMSPYALPVELKALQSQDVSKIGYMQDLIRGIEKLIGSRDSAHQSKGFSINPEALVERAAIFVEDGNWSAAEEYCEKALDADPKNAKAYLLKLMSFLKIRHVNEFMEIKTPFGDNYSYEKAVRFADPIMQGNLKKYEMNARYLCAASLLETGTSKNDLLNALEMFRKLGSYRDSASLKAEAEQRISGYEEEYFREAKELIASPKDGDDLLRAKKLLSEGVITAESEMLARQCEEKLESLYIEAEELMKSAKTSDEYSEAFRRFRYLGDYKNSNSLEFVCATRYQAALEYEKELQLEEERRAEAEAIEREIKIKTEVEKKKSRAISARIFPISGAIAITGYIVTTIYQKVADNGYLHPSLLIPLLVSSCVFVAALLLLEGLFNGEVDFSRWQIQKLIIVAAICITTICMITLGSMFIYGGISLAAHAISVLIGTVLAKKLKSI